MKRRIGLQCVLSNEDKIKISQSFVLNLFIAAKVGVAVGLGIGVPLIIVIVALAIIIAKLKKQKKQLR